jgi:glycosyltransferase involved in cell wall biosynthesis
VNLVWFSWKDLSHPLAGGAEVVADNILSRLAQDGHNVTLITSSPKGLKKEEYRRGYRIIRSGNRYTVYTEAPKSYRRYLQTSDEPDYVIDEMNTIPFWAKKYSDNKQTKHYLLAHQLCRIVWFYQMIFPISVIGYLLEPLYLYATSRIYSNVLTISNSSVNDLKRFGFKKNNIQVISMGIDQTNFRIEPISSKNKGQIVCLGAIRAMKGTLSVAKAFSIISRAVPHARLIFIGDDSGKYADKVRKYCSKNLRPDTYKFMGRIDLEEKQRTLRSSVIQLIASAKEGWGLTVSEAGSLGTIAVAYDTEGIRDSIINGKTGLLSSQNPRDLAIKALSILNDDVVCARMRKAALEKSRKMTFEASYNSFLNALGENK